MREMIKNIINARIPLDEKNKQLDLIKDDIKLAEMILSGKFKYCPECDDYYLAESYFDKIETKKIKICVYDDPINSGGNDYEDGFADVTYRICPKGHKHEVCRNERRK